MIHYLIAMPREAELFRKYFDGLPAGEIDVIGINAVDLEQVKSTEEDILVNIGYAGGYKIPVGTLVEPSFVLDVQTWEAARIDPVFLLEHRMCLTSNTFVESPIYDGPSLYDMELFKIMSLPHKRVHSIKIISDNLCEKDCEEFNSDAAWKLAAELIKLYLKE